MTPYLKLRLANRGRGDFRAEGGDLFLYDAIAMDDDEADWMGGVSPARFAQALAAASGPVRLRVNSPGGSAFGGIAMAQAIREHDGPVTAQVDGVAASAATIVIAAAAETVMAPGSMLMIHRASALVMGDAEEMMRAAATLETVDASIAGAYAARAGDADWPAMMAAETWFDADAAVAAGLADRVIDTSSQRGAAAQARWDLTAYDKAPLALAAAQADADRAHRVRRLTAGIATRSL